MIQRCMVNVHRKIFKHMEGLFKKVMMHAYEVASRSIIRLPEAELVQLYRLKVPVERVVKFHFSMN